MTKTAAEDPKDIIASVIAGCMSSAQRAYHEHTEAADDVLTELEVAGYKIVRKNV